MTPRCVEIYRNARPRWGQQWDGDHGERQGSRNRDESRPARLPGSGSEGNGSSTQCLLFAPLPGKLPSRPGIRALRAIFGGAGDNGMSRAVRWPISAHRSGFRANSVIPFTGILRAPKEHRSEIRCRPPGAV